MAGRKGNGGGRVSRKELAGRSGVLEGDVVTGDYLLGTRHISHFGQALGETGGGGGGGGGKGGSGSNWRRGGNWRRENCRRGRRGRGTGEEGKRLVGTGGGRTGRGIAGGWGSGGGDWRIGK
ncbi:uncharacterized protein [Hetaerina americana]|uniref:uncharacterized protein n=1 Tax=Hetaerina americana TaxID=62018 RepID=UPI003A7F4A1C